MIEAVANSGEEVVVNKATLRVWAIKIPTNTVSADYQFRMILAGYAADTAFTDPTAGNATQHVLDDLLDTANAGDFEFRVLAELDSSFQPVLDNAGELNSPPAKVEKLIDISNYARMTAKQLARSALFATDPLAGIVSVYLSKDDGLNCQVRFIVELEYFVQPRQLRMLGAEH